MYVVMMLLPLMKVLYITLPGDFLLVLIDIVQNVVELIQLLFWIIDWMCFSVML
jgi:hypothetical protein